MNCKDCADRLEAFTDRELSQDEVLEVQQHLDHCPPCVDRFHFQADLKRLVKVCCDQGEAPEALRARLREILY